MITAMKVLIATVGGKPKVNTFPVPSLLYHWEEPKMHFSPNLVVSLLYYWELFM
jgi:hypothetical protein